MKINAVITKKPLIKFNRAKLSLVDKNIISIASIMFLSIVSGSLIYKFKPEVFKESVFEMFVAFSTDLSGKSFFEAFSGFFAVDLSVLIILSILGASTLGGFPILAAAAFRTLGIGAIGAYLFDSYAFAGLKYFLAVILPGKGFMFFALLLTVQNCFQTSRKIRLITLKKSNEEIDYKIYALRNATALVFFALSSVIDTLLIKYVSQYFMPDF